MALRKNELGRLCMSAKGWMAVPASAARQPEYTPPATAPQQAAPTTTDRVSKYALSAEAIAKADGCVITSTMMTMKGAGGEWFKVGCVGGLLLSISCDTAGCRMLK